MLYTESKNSQNMDSTCCTVADNHYKFPSFDTEFE